MIFRVVIVAAFAQVLGVGCTTDVVDFALEQELICKEPLDDAGSGCRVCWWSADPQAVCQICGDPAKPEKDSCHIDAPKPQHPRIPVLKPIKDAALSLVISLYDFHAPQPVQKVLVEVHADM